VVDATRATVDNEAELVAASARFLCPLASSYLAVSVQDLMAADSLLLRSGRRLIPVTGLARPPSQSPRPSLQSHYSPFITTTPQSAPVHRIRYSRLRFSDLGVLPFPLSPRDDGTTGSRVSVQKPAPHSCHLYAGHRLAKNETTRQAHPRADARPWF
jgi:hypothetical protein